MTGDAGLPRDQAWFARPAPAVARDLVGAVLAVETAAGPVRARLVEVEAYGGEDDPASHAGRGPTPRSRIMFGPAGYAYVYVIYGLHHCLNLVTGKPGAAGAVLIRAAEPLTGLPDEPRLLAGPGKAVPGPGHRPGLERPAGGGRPGGARAGCACWRGPRRARVAATPRIGIRRAAERPWRFTDPDSASLSR